MIFSFLFLFIYLFIYFYYIYLQVQSSHAFLKSPRSNLLIWVIHSKKKMLPKPFGGGQISSASSGAEDVWPSDPLRKELQIFRYSIFYLISSIPQWLCFRRCIKEKPAALFMGTSSLSWTRGLLPASCRKQFWPGRWEGGGLGMVCFRESFRRDTQGTQGEKNTQSNSWL